MLNAASELEESSFECGASISDDGVGSLMVSEEGGQSRLPGRTPTCAMFYSVNSPQDALCKLLCS